MALPKFLLQVRDGQRSNVYRWTEVLAKRKDMRPITGKEAKKILDDRKAERDERNRIMAEDPFIDTEEDFSPENDITADPDLTEDEKTPAEHPSFKTQDILKAEELSKIPKFATKNELESYFLEKYQLDMMAGNREHMNEQAQSFVEELAKHGKLYTKLNE